MAGFLDQPTLLRNSDAHLPPPAITTFTRYSGSTGARRPFHPARTPLAAALNTHLGSVSGRSTASRSSSCASAARSAAANSWCTSPAKRSKSCSAAGCSVSRRSSAFNSLTIWCSWSLLLVAPWGPLSERGFLDIPNQLYPKECCPSSPAQLNSPTRLIDHHELHHRKRRSTRARRATSLRVTLCHRRPSNVSWNPLYPLESLNSRPTPIPFRRIVKIDPRFLSGNLADASGVGVDWSVAHFVVAARTCGDFPAPVRLGGRGSRAVGWRRVEVERWLEALPKA